MAMANFWDAESTLKRRYEHRWRTLASQIDKVCAAVLPATYVVCLGILFNLELSDQYITDPEAPMFVFLGPAAISAAGAARGFTPLFLCLAGFAVWCAWRARKRCRVPKECGVSSAQMDTPRENEVADSEVAVPSMSVAAISKVVRGTTAESTSPTRSAQGPTRFVVNVQAASSARSWSPGMVKPQGYNVKRQEFAFGPPDNLSL